MTRPPAADGRGGAPVPSARRHRAAVAVTFLAAGFGLAAWVVHIPRIMTRTGLTDAGLGVLLVVMGAASLAAMQLGGLMAARIGSRAVTACGGPVLAVGLVCAGLAPDPLWLGAALILFGAGTSLLDIGMNDQAVRVEQLYDRPIMSAFHAWFSVGGAIGALIGGPLLTLDAPPVLTLAIMAAVSLLSVSLGLPRLLPGTHAEPVPVTGRLEVVPQDGSGRATAASSPARTVLVLAAMAFSFFLAEGVVNDWSARHAVTALGVDAAAATIAYGVFSTTMTICRFAADRVASALGSVRVLRYGALVAALGLAVVVLSPTYPLTVLGWAVYGVGLAGIVPQLFSTAGSLVSGPRAAVILSRVVGAGYAGLLAGPAVVGWLSGLVGLTAAFVLPLLLCVVGAVLAATLHAPRRTADPAG